MPVEWCDHLSYISLGLVCHVSFENEGLWSAFRHYIIEFGGFDEAGGVFAGGQGVEMGLATFDFGAFLVADVFGDPMRSMRPKRWMMRTGFQWMS